MAARQGVDANSVAVVAKFSSVCWGPSQQQAVCLPKSQFKLYSETEDGLARHEPAQSGPSALCSRRPQADCEDSDLAVTSIHISHLSWKHQAYIPGSMPQHGTSISDLHLPAAGQCRSLEGHNFNQVLLSGADFHLF